jgi:short-subunit dehydrogenase
MTIPPPSDQSIALVTGASSGIGEQFARQLAARGHNVFLVARRRERIRDLAAELEREHGVRAEFVACDLGDPAARDALPETAARRELQVEVLINNAGFGTTGDLHSDPDRQTRMVRVNCEAPVALTAAFVPAMVERGRGAVLNVASVVAFQPMPAQAVYAATKAFMLSFSEALSSELRKTGVSVTALCPGPVETEFTEVAEFKRPASETPSFVWSSAEDVARAGLQGLEKGKRVVIPGIGNRAAAAMGHYTPHFLFFAGPAKLYRRAIGE